MVVQLVISFKFIEKWKYGLLLCMPEHIDVKKKSDRYFFHLREHHLHSSSRKSDSGIANVLRAMRICYCCLTTVDKVSF